MQLSEPHFIKVPNNKNIRIGHQEVIKAKDLGTSLKLTAKTLGKTYLNFGNTSKQILVLQKNIFQTYKILQPIIKSAMGLNIYLESRECTITGELLRITDWEKIYNAQKNVIKTCKFKAKIHPLIRTDVIEYLNANLKQNFIKNVDIHIKQNLTLSTPQLTNKKTNYINQRLKAWGLELKVFQTIKPRPQLVQVKLLLAEVSKSQSQSLGFNWDQNFQAQLLPGADVLGSWMVELNTLESKGKGRILASPTLVAESGSKAEFLAGGEFPVRVKGYRSSKVIWKKHGLLFKIQPKVDDSERIFLKIESEVSMLDANNSVDGIPGIKVSRLISQFNLDNGQTIALSGLIQERFGTSNSGLPFLKSIPVLGKLFSSENYQQEKSELIIFIQPNIFSQNKSITFPISKELNEYD